MIERAANIHDVEAKFHDQWARGVNLAEIRVHEAFEAPTAVENRFILERNRTIVADCDFQRSDFAHPVRCFGGSNHAALTIE